MLGTFTKGGIHPSENKLSADRPIVKAPLPTEVAIMVSQHIGAPAQVLVKPNEKVKVGQLLAQSGGFVSANVHSSVSGTVKKIDNIVDSSGYSRPTIIITVEGDDWDESIDRSANLVSDISLTPEEITKKIATAGIVGLGGATFPTHVKLSPPPGAKAEVLIINGVECEPYLTADHRLMLERGEELLIGVTILMKALKVNRAIIGIEKNKPDAIENLQNLSKNYSGVEIAPLTVKYPQGSEKHLIKATINREVPSGGLPIAVGAVVQNVGTVVAVYEAVQKNKPLFERVVTVTGLNVKNPSNFLARIGTPISFLIDAAGGMPENTGKIISGGSMMGRALAGVASPTNKGTSGILLIPDEKSKREQPRDCVRCAKCVSVCPMGLEPYLLMALAERSMWDRIESEHVMDCIECGSCSYTCPANRFLLDYIRLGKTTVGKIIRSRK